jgi:hypothetical protein
MYYTARDGRIQAQYSDGHCDVLWQYFISLFYVYLLCIRYLILKQKLLHYHRPRWYISHTDSIELINSADTAIISKR